jgi:glutaredoxin
MPMTEAHKIMVYALSTCPYCKRTKRFLDDHKVKYEHVDVDMLNDDEQDKTLDKVEKLTGRRSFPVVIIGEEWWVGHDEEKLKKALKL